MRNLRISLAAALSVLLFAPAGRAQSLTVLTETGPRANRVNLVFVAEGYTAGQQAKFLTDAAARYHDVVADEAFTRFSSYINGYAVFVASAESGADNDPTLGVLRDTYFNARFYTADLQRLLTVSDSKVFSVLTQVLPDYDIVVVLVNSTTYGGSGGRIAVASLNEQSTELVLHELGHSFALLLDEYIESTSGNLATFVEAPNGTRQTTRSAAPWGRFIDPSTTLPTADTAAESVIGLFEGVNYYPSGVYRPTITSKMKVLGKPFGAVNVRAFIAEVHRLNLQQTTAAPVIATQPASQAVAAGSTATFTVAATGAGPLSYQWSLNGQYIAGATLSSLQIGSVSGTSTGTYAVEVTNAAGTATSQDATLSIQVAAPAITSQPANATAANGEPVILAVTASGPGPLTYQWYFNGSPLGGATSSSLLIGAFSPSHVGFYSVVVTGPGGDVASRTAIVSLPPPTTKVTGTGTEVGSDIVHPNGNVYDQVLLQGTAATITADAGQVTRMSFIDLDDDIVQVEFSGAGSLTLALDNATGPAAPTKYFQPGVVYMRGHATITIVDAGADTHVSVFSVGRANAINQQLFLDGVDYDGVADVALLSIGSPAGRMGGVRAGNAAFGDSAGLTGLNAPGVRIGGPVVIHNVTASGGARPVLLTGAIDTGEIVIAGGDLLQANAAAVGIGEATSVRFSAGETSHGTALQARPNQARIERDGIDVTASVVRSEP